MPPGVHPRERGGSITVLSVRIPPPGPSPRARGKRGRRLDPRSASRSIPASAGEASPASCRARRAGVHPLERGGSRWPSGRGRFQGGPSPRARGKHGLGGVGDCRHGSIPASAGEASLSTWRTRSERVHPRERGGSGRCGCGRAGRPGPSPRARGKLNFQLLRTLQCGSIPASAGEAARAAGHPPRGRVHPRERGGSTLPLLAAASYSGPSPRARGKPIANSHAAKLPRSIPASAGEARPPGKGRRPRRVHPRERGGSAKVLASLGIVWGPSPRARGKPERRTSTQLPCRSIPASAGEARSGSTGSGRRRVHPRERGGSNDVPKYCLLAAGPSPRARGKLCQHGALVLQRGSIPASAGEASYPAWRRPNTRVHPRERGGSSTA